MIRSKKKSSNRATVHRRESSGALVSPWRVGAEFRPRLNSMNNLVRNPTKFSGTSGEAETASQWAELKKIRSETKQMIKRLCTVKSRVLAHLIWKDMLVFSDCLLSRSAH